MPENVYTVKLIDIIINPKALEDPTRLKRVFLVMDYIDFDLRVLLEQQNQSSEEHVITILYNILCALNFIHSANLMHRDVKPENILLNEDCSILFCDFGMSRSMLPCTKNFNGQSECGSFASASTARTENINPENRTVHKNNKSDQKMNRELSPHMSSRFYRAPEVILTQKDYTCQIDMWSIGCILGEMLMKPGSPKSKENQLMFKGSSCFPLSPPENGVGEDDQLTKIL